MLDIVLRGGPVMIPLFVCSVIAVAVSIERLWYLLSNRTDAEDLMESIKLALGQGKMLEAMQLAKNSKGALAAVLAAGIAHCDQGSAAVKEHIQRMGRDEIFKMERRMIVLDSIITIAPLLGLLGTVTGIIRSFRVLAAMQGISQPSVLSSGIAEALVTTATGLIIAIPTMAVYSYLQSVIDRRVAELNRHSTELTQLLEFRKGA